MKVKKLYFGDLEKFVAAIGQKNIENIGRAFAGAGDDENVVGVVAPIVINAISTAPQIMGRLINLFTDLTEEQIKALEIDVAVNIIGDGLRENTDVIKKFVVALKNLASLVAAAGRESILVK